MESEEAEVSDASELQNFQLEMHGPRPEENVTIQSTSVKIVDAT